MSQCRSERFCNQTDQCRGVARADRDAIAAIFDAGSVAAAKSGIGSMAPQSRARFGGGATDAASADSSKAANVAGMGDRGLLSSADRSWRRYLRMASN